MATLKQRARQLLNTPYLTKCLQIETQIETRMETHMETQTQKYNYFNTW